MISSEEVQDYVIKYAQQDIEEAMPVIIGLFVGLVEAYVTLRGQDCKQQITLESQRQIIIGPEKE